MADFWSCCWQELFFFSYYQVDKVEVMGTAHYSDEQVKKMVLAGGVYGIQFRSCSFFPSQNTEDVPFVEGYTVTRLNRHTICISVREKKAVGCILIWTVIFILTETVFLLKVPGTRNELVPFFDGIEVSNVIQNEKLQLRMKRC